MTYGETTTLIVQSTIDHPTWTANDHALHLGISPASVRGVASKLSIVLPSERLKLAQERAARVGLAKKPFRKVGYAGKPKGSVY